MNKTILKTLVGSRAHNLNDEDSDWDYRSVFITPTVEFLSIGSKPKTTSWVEGEVDDTAWELSHFLNLAVKSNPSILEVFVSPVIESLSIGEALRDLFPYVWNSTDVYNAFSGYGKNQRKKMLEDDTDRWRKYAVAYIRTLINGYCLLDCRTFSVDTTIDEDIHGQLLKIRRGEWTKGEVINTAERLQSSFLEAYKNNSDKKTDLDKVNEFLINARRLFWGDYTYVMEHLKEKIKLSTDQK